MKISILGSGSFAIAISKILTDNGHNVLMWTVDEEQVKEINEDRTSKFYFPDYKLSKKVSATSTLDEIVNYSNIIIVAIPSKFIGQTLKKLNKVIKNNFEKYKFINMSKGLDYKNVITISQMIEKYIDDKNIESISSMTGASFAGQIIDNNITRFTLASTYDDKDEIKKIFENDYIIIDKSEDIIGIEMLSSIKNVIALASGIIEGLGYQDNTRSIIISLGIREMNKLKNIYNISEDTLFSSSGIGDLVLTSLSKTSRNYIAGYNVGQGKSIDDAIIDAKTIVEGVDCIKVMKKIEKKYNIELPVSDAMYKIFYKYANVKNVIFELLKK